MIRSIGFFLFVVCLQLSHSAVETPTSPEINQANEQKEQLELEILQEELIKLRRENESSTISLALSIVGGLIALGTLVWTIITGLQSFNYRTKEQRATRISNLLENLSNETYTVRLGAARALKLDIDQASSELLSAAETEKSLVVRQAIADALAAGNAETIRSVVEANAKTLPTRAFLLGRLSALDGKEAEQYHSLVGLTKDDVKKLLQRYRPHFQQGQLIDTLHPSQRGENGITELTQTAEHATLLAKLTALVISKVLRNQCETTIVSGELDLSETNLYKVCMKDIKLNNALLLKSILRHAELINTQIINTNLNSIDLYDAKIQHCTLIECNLSNAHFRESKIESTTLTQCNLSEATFSLGTIEQTNFQDSILDNTKLRGCQISNTTFAECSLVKSEMQGAELIECTFSNARLYRANLRGAHLRNATAVAAKFNGADLRSSDFQDSNLQNADFSGADIANTNFNGANVDGARFKNSKNLDKAHFTTPPTT